MQGLKVVVDVPDARAKVYSRNVRWLASACRDGRLGLGKCRKGVHARFPAANLASLIFRRGYGQYGVESA